jgi:CHAD domain-containing protein
VSDVPRKILHVLGARLGSPRSLPAVGRHKPAGNLLRRRLAEQVEELQRRDSQVRAGSAEGIHQARVACRRMRSALATYRPLVDRAVTDPLRDELQWLGRALADARDAKVVRARLGALVDSESEGLVGRDVRPRLADTYEGRARAAGAEVAEVLDSDRYFALLDALDLLVAEPPFTSRAGKPADEVLRPRVRKDWKRLRRSLAMAEEAEDRDLAMHRARKDAKRFRYAVEALAPVWHKDARRLAKAAKKLTSHLGERQDTVVTRQHLIDIARSAEAAGEGGFTWGRLHAREEALALRLDEDLSGLWGKVSRKKLRAWMR